MNDRPYTFSFKKILTDFDYYTFMVIDKSGHAQYANSITDYLPIGDNFKNNKVYKIIYSKGQYELRRETVYCGKFETFTELMEYLDDMASSEF